MKRYLIIMLALLLLAAGCGGGDSGGENEAVFETDPESGLPLNPETIPEGSFIVEGEITSLNLTPQTAPEFVVRAPSGRTFRIRPQGLVDITYEDGESVPIAAFAQGLPVRATVTETDADQSSGNIGILVSDDLVVLR